MYAFCRLPKDDRLAAGLMARLKTVANYLAKADPEFSQQASKLLSIPYASLVAPDLRGQEGSCDCCCPPLPGLEAWHLWHSMLCHVLLPDACQREVDVDFFDQPDSGTSLLQAVPPALCTGNLSKRQQRVLAMEDTAYDVRWVGGEPIIVQDPSCKHLLSTEDEHFILQHARAKKLASQPKKPAASAQPSGSMKPSQQATKGAARHCDTPPNFWCWPGVSLYTLSLWMSRLSLGDLQAEMRCFVGADGMPAKGAANVSDDDASSCPSLETDDDLIKPYSGPAHPPQTREPGSSRRNARVEEVDEAVDDDSDSDVDGKCPSWLPMLQAMAEHP